MKINEEILIETIKILNNYFSKTNIKSLSNVEFPKEIKYKSNEWLIYMFYSCLLDYGMRSQNYHKNLINTYHKYPQIFDSNYVLNKLTKEELLNIMKKNIHPRYPNIAVEKWINLSLELSRYDSLIDTIKKFNSFNELNMFVRKIKGYGQKTGGLLLRLIYESKICKFNDNLSYIPLDRHDIEISYLNNIICSQKLNNKQIEELSKLYIEKGKKLGIDANVLDKYLWNIGNEFCNKKKCTTCPLYTNCKTKI